MRKLNSNPVFCHWLFSEPELNLEIPFPHLKMRCVAVFCRGNRNKSRHFNRRSLYRSSKACNIFARARDGEIRAVSRCQSNNSTTMSMSEIRKWELVSTEWLPFHKKLVTGAWMWRMTSLKLPMWAREWPLPSTKLPSYQIIGRTSITFISLVAKKSGKFTFQPSNPCNIKEILKIMDMNSGCQLAISSPWSRPDDFCAISNIPSIRAVNSSYTYSTHSSPVWERSSNNEKNLCNPDGSTLALSRRTTVQAADVIS